MKRFAINSAVFLFLFILFGCAPATMNQMVKDGNKPLSPKQLRSTISGNTLQLESIDFDAKVQFLPDGRLSAKNNQGESDRGNWTISEEKQLCLKFRAWYFNDIHCYTVIEDDDNRFVFFTNNGARYYSGTLLNVPTVSSDAVEKDISSLPSSTSLSGARSPEISKVEEKHTMIQLARNCADCKLSGIDLQDAELITANLSGADLSGADLSGANLRRANLSGADLSRAKLQRTNLAGANLVGCNLQNADLTGSNLIRADVTGANLDGAIFTKAYLEQIKGMAK